MKIFSILLLAILTVALYSCSLDSDNDNPRCVSWTVDLAFIEIESGAALTNGSIQLIDLRDNHSYGTAPLDTMGRCQFTGFNEQPDAANLKIHYRITGCNSGDIENDFTELSLKEDTHFPCIMNGIIQLKCVQQAP